MVGLTLLATVISGCTGPDQPPTQDPAAPDFPVRHITWTAESLEGFAAFEITSLLEAPTTCRVSAFSTHDQARGGSLLALVVRGEGDDSWSWIADRQFDMAHAHVGDVVDTRRDYPRNDAYYLQADYPQIQVSSVLTFLVIATDLTSTTDPPDPQWNNTLDVDLICGEPVADVSYQAAQDAVAMTQHLAEATAGAHADASFARASLTAEGTASLEAKGEKFEAFGVSSSAVLTATLSTPTGEVTWLETEGNFHHDDEPGDYSFKYSRTGGGTSDGFWFVMYDLSPVHALGDAYTVRTSTEGI